MADSSGARAADAAYLTIAGIDFERGVLFFEDGKGNKDREGFISAAAAEHVRAYIKGGRTALLERMPRRRGPVPAGSSNLLETDVLFLSSRGRPGEIGLTPSGVLQMLTRRYKKGGGALPSFGPHRLRHGWRRTWPNRALTSERSSAGVVGRIFETVSIYVHMDTTRVRSEQDRVQGPLFDKLAAEARPKVA